MQNHMERPEIKQALIRQEFSANVSHELKTPLHASSGYAELLENGLVKEEDIKPFAEKIHAESLRMTRLIEDYERIADHAVSILESAEEMKSKNVTFSENAAAEYKTICDAVTEILDLSYQAFSKDDIQLARKTEPLEQVINKLKEELRTRHFIRLQNRECSVAAGFIWSDLLTNLERVSDHCSNISGCVLDTAGRNMNMHENQRIIRDSKEDFEQRYHMYLVSTAAEWGSFS